MKMNSNYLLMLLWCCVLSVAPIAQADTCLSPDPQKPYQLVFSDEFNGSQLDRGKWNTEFLWGPSHIINNEMQYYVNEGQFNYDPFVVANGKLSIQAIKTPYWKKLDLYLTRSIYSDTSIELLWRSPVNAVRYEVYRDQKLVGTVSGGAFFDPTLEEGFDYAYEVVALDQFGNRIVASQLTVNTAERPTPATPPEVFSLKPEARIYSASHAEIIWNRPNRAAGYHVYRNGTLYKNFNGRSVYETSLESGRDYNYRIVAFDGCGDFIIEESIRVNTASGPTPQAPLSTRLKLRHKIYSKYSAEIYWEPLEGATSYDILESGNLLRNTDGRSHFVGDLVPGIDRPFLIIARDASGIEIDRQTRTLNSKDNSYALNQQPYLSGIITSYESFKFLYGRAEARLRMPSGKGLWSAFWLLNAYYNQDQPEDPEIDIVEALGHDPYSIHQNYHHVVDSDGDGFHTDYLSSEHVASVSDFSARFHVYAVDWSPGRVIWSIDGVETRRLEGSEVSSEQMYILANLAVGGDFPGAPDESTPFPSSFEIDYIRVYQRR